MYSVRLALFIFVLFILIQANKSRAEQSATHGSETRESRATSESERPSSNAKEENIKLLTELFEIRPQTAELREEALRKSIEKEDDREAARIIASLLGTRYKPQKEKILETLKKEIEKDEVKNDPKRLKMVQRLIWTVEDALNKEPGSSAVEAGFKKLAKEANEKVAKDVAEFNENAKKAADGDAEARKAILKDYSPDTLIDFMASQQSVEVAKALGWKDKDGNWSIDLKADDPGFRKDNTNATQSWQLGKTDDEIKKSIKEFGKVHGSDAESSTDSSNRFHRFTLNPNPGERISDRHLFKLDENGKSVPVVHSSDKEKLCQTETAQPDKVVPLEHTAWYFFRQFPNSEFVGYAADVNGTSQNRVINLNEPGKEFEVPGPYDPVPTQDEKYVTVPEFGDGEGIKFYKTEDIKKLGKDAKPIFADKTLTGVYQSIGTVTSDAQSTTYRIITDRKSLSFRDYKVTHDSGGQPKVEALESGPIELCKNTGISLVTPMLSKDGKQVSFLDVEEGVTKIFDIVNPKTGECKLSLNLGIYTGKVDFNYNGDEITFHKYENERPRERYITVPSDDLVGNVYVYSRSKKQLTRLTDNTNSNSIYPNFRKDGKVMMLNHKHDESGKEKSSLSIVDPKKGRPVNADFIFQPSTRENDEREKKWHAATALGALWSRVCSPAGANVSSEGAVLATLNLFPERCKELVQDYWLSYKIQIAKERELAKSSRIRPGTLALLTPKEVAAACPTSGGTPPPTSGNNDDDRPSGGNTGGSGGGQTAGIPQVCFGCHSNSANFIPFNDPARMRTEKAKRTRNADGSLMTWAEAILERITTSDPELRMPQQGSLTTAERVAIRKFLEP